MPTVTCVLPAHNEGESIRQTLLEINNVIGSRVSLTIFVSEDGSSDETRDEVLSVSLAGLSSSIELSSPSNRLGYSKAVQRGIANSSSSLTLFMDADGQCDPADFEALLEAFEPGSVVVGYRNPRVDSFQRKLFSRLFGLAYRLLGFPSLRDPSSPYVLVETRAIESFSSTDWRLSFGFWWEFQARIAALGLPVVEVPVRHRPRASGETQVYRLRKLPDIIASHLRGLALLRQDLN